jgi:hypothetical protein
MKAEFVEVDAIRLVDCTSIDDVERLDVTDNHVRLVLRLTPEERQQLDVKALRARLMERGARTVIDSIVVVRDSVTRSAEIQGRTSLERGVQVLRGWLDGCGEDQDVVERSIEMLDQVAR